jgi:multidrug efflux pump subunit AcrA (membrane-fusion protein)
VPGLVTQVLVKVGATVKQGDPLFKLDDRDLQAELIVRQSSLSTAKAKLEKLKNLPRPEDVPPAEAKVAEALASLNDAKQLRAMWNGVEKQGIVSAEELQRRDSAVAVAQAKYDQAQSELKLLQAGSWKPDIEIAGAEVAAADAQVKATQTNIERLTVTAPVDGEVLQVKVRPGEYAQAGPLATPLMLLGDVSKVHVRVDIDENDAWRVAADASAVATVRGNRDLKTNLKFVRIEPYVVPKKSLTGESTERVDTRVLQVLYSFDRRVSCRCMSGSRWTCSSRRSRSRHPRRRLRSRDRVASVARVFNPCFFMRTAKTRVENPCYTKSVGNVVGTGRHVVRDLRFDRRGRVDLVARLLFLEQRLLLKALGPT